MAGYERDSDTVMQDILRKIKGAGRVLGPSFGYTPENYNPSPLNLFAPRTPASSSVPSVATARLNSSVPSVESLRFAPSSAGSYGSQDLQEWINRGRNLPIPTRNSYPGMKGFRQGQLDNPKGVRGMPWMNNTSYGAGPEGAIKFGGMLESPEPEPKAKPERNIMERVREVADQYKETPNPLATEPWRALPSGLNTDYMTGMITNSSGSRPFYRDNGMVGRPLSQEDADAFSEKAYAVGQESPMPEIRYGGLGAIPGGLPLEENLGRQSDMTRAAMMTRDVPRFNAGGHITGYSQVYDPEAAGKYLSGLEDIRTRAMLDSAKNEIDSRRVGVLEEMLPEDKALSRAHASFYQQQAEKFSNDILNSERPLTKLMDILPKLYQPAEDRYGNKSTKVDPMLIKALPILFKDPEIRQFFEQYGKAQRQTPVRPPSGVVTPGNTTGKPTTEKRYRDRFDEETSGGGGY